MKWICIYCHRIMDKSNFTDFIRDSDYYPNTEYHAWRHLDEEEKEAEAKAQMLLALC